MSDDADSIVDFVHPKVAMYLFGPEDGALPENVLARCSKKLYIPTAYSLNLYSAATVVCYDRIAKLANRVDVANKCPMCGQEHEQDQACPKCGYDTKQYDHECVI